MLVFFTKQARRYMRIQGIRQADPYTIATFVCLGISILIDITTKLAQFVIEIIVRNSDPKPDYSTANECIEIFLRSSSSIRNISLMINVARWFLVIHIHTRNRVSVRESTLDSSSKKSSRKESVLSSASRFSGRKSE